MSQAKSEQDKESGCSRESTVVYHESEFKYFQAERDKLQSARDRYISETKKPERREYVPDVFNSLEPYTDLTVYNTALEVPLETERYQYKTRKTAKGLCDPWVSYDMDVNFEENDVPPATSRSQSSAKRPSTDRSQRSEKKERPSTRDEKKRDDKQPTKQENQKTCSTPIFPTVKAVPNELSGKPLNYSHVPQLREELRKTYSANADRRIEEAYKLTKDEYHRRQLDRVSQYHPDTWPSMRAAYFAYLQNNPGSAKAVRECVRDSEKENRKKNNQDRTENQQKTKQPDADKERKEDDQK